MDKEASILKKEGENCRLREIILQKRREVRNSETFRKFCNYEADLAELIKRFEALNPGEQGKIKCKRDIQMVLKRAPSRYWVLAEKDEDSIREAVSSKNNRELSKIISDLALIEYDLSQSYCFANIRNLICGLKYRLNHLNDGSPLGADPDSCHGRNWPSSHRPLNDR